MARTPEGQQAYRILNEAFSKDISPESARRMLHDLADRATDPQARREISDVATMVARLVPPASGRSISSQMG
jgi:hypothetical protein